MDKLEIQIENFKFLNIGLFCFTLLLLVLFLALIDLLSLYSFVFVFSIINFVLILLINYYVSGRFIHPFFLTSLSFITYFGLGLIFICLQEGSIKALYTLILSLYFFSFGGFVFNWLFKINSKMFLLFFRFQKFNKFSLPSNISLYFLWIIGFLAYLYLIKKIGIPIFSTDLFIRYKVSGLQNSIFEIFWIISCTGLLVKAKAVNNTKLLYKSLILILISLVLYTSLLHRYASLQLLLSLFIAYFCIEKPSIRKYSKWLTIFLLIIFGIQFLRSSKLETILGNTTLFNIVVSRLFLIGAKTFYFIVDNFPETYSFFYGTTYIRRIRNLFYPEDKMPSLGYFLYREVTGHENPGYDPVSILGEFYINFGFLGVSIGMFMWGFIIQWFYYKFLRKKTVYNLTAFSIYSMFFIRSFAYSLPGEIFNFLIANFGFLILYLLSGRKEM